MKTVMYDTSRRVRNVTNDGMIPMKLELFDSGYEAVLPSPAVFKLKERVHVQVGSSVIGEIVPKTRRRRRRRRKRRRRKRKRKEEEGKEEKEEKVTVKGCGLLQCRW